MPSPRMIAFCQWYVTMVTSLTLIVCLLVAFGWWQSLPLLTSIVPGAPPMMPNTVVGLVALAVALWLLRHEPVSTRARLGAVILAGAAVLIGALTLLQYLTGWQLGVDRWLLPLADPSLPVPHPGRPAPRTAICFVLLGAAVIRLSSASCGRHFLCQVLALGAALVPYTALIGYAYDARILFQLAPLIPMALSTAVLLLFLSLGVLAARPTWGPMEVITSAESGGQLIRRLLVPFAIFELVLGWAILGGADLGWYASEYAAGLIAVSNSVVFGGLIIWIARSLNRQEEGRRRAEAEAKKYVTLLRHVIANAPVTLFATDREGRLLLIEGRNRDGKWPLHMEAVGQPLTHVFAEHPHLITAFEGALQGRPVRELLLVDDAAFDVWFEPPADVAIVTGVIAVATDITERLQAEEALKRQNAEMQAIFEATVDGILLLDEHQRLRGYNQRYAVMWGLPPSLVSTADAHALFSEMSRRIRGRSPFLPEPGRASRQVGPTGWDEYALVDGRVFEHYVAEVASEEGASYGRAWYFRDVTERKQLERHLREQNDQLKALDELKDDFVNTITHDLRSPLMTINGYAELLEDGAAGAVSPEGLAFVAEIRKATTRLERMVSDLLEVARIQAGTLHIDCKRVDLVQVCQAVLASFAPRAKASEVDLALAYEGGPLPADLDAPRIEQVLSNLIGNALKFTPSGGQIVVRLHRTKGQLCVEVEDTGEGIAAQDIPRLFQRFSALESGVRRGGTGLGLWISKSIVEAHGGSIGVRSVEGKGSTFWFCLP